MTDDCSSRHGEKTRNREAFSCLWSFWFCPTSCGGRGFRSSARKANSNHAIVLHVYAIYPRNGFDRRRRKLLMFTRTTPRIAVIEQLNRCGLLPKVNKCFLNNVLLRICECAMQPRAKLTQIMRTVTKKLRKQEMQPNVNAALLLKKCAGGGAYSLSLPKLPVIVMNDNVGVTGISRINTRRISAKV